MDSNTITFYFRYNRLKKLNKKGMALVQLMAYKRKTRKQKFISTDIYLKPEQWNKKDSLIINHELAAQLNWKLSDLKRSYEKKVIDLIKSMTNAAWRISPEIIQVAIFLLYTFGTHMANKIPPHLLQMIMQHKRL